MLSVAEELEQQNAVKRQHVFEALHDPETAFLSARAIARRLNVDASWVSKLRRELLGVAPDPKKQAGARASNAARRADRDDGERETTLPSPSAAPACQCGQTAPEIDARDDEPPELPDNAEPSEWPTVLASLSAAVEVVEGAAFTRITKDGPSASEIVAALESKADDLLRLARSLRRRYAGRG